MYICIYIFNINFKTVAMRLKKSVRIARKIRKA